MLSSSGRRTEIVEALAKYPLTAPLLLELSAAFAAPLRSLRRAREVLLELHRGGYVERQPLASTRRGEPEQLYFLTRKARRFAPFVAELSTHNAVFRGLADGTEIHDLAAVQVAVLIEKAAAALPGRARVLQVVRPGHFRVPIEIQVRHGRPEERRSTRRLLIPDMVFVLELDGRRELVCLELQHHAPVIVGAAGQERSFRHKLYRYRELFRRAGEFAEVQRLERLFGRLNHRLLVVTTRGPAHLANLIGTAGQQKRVLFATLEDLAGAGNILANSCWKSATRSAAAILVGSEERA